MASQTDNSQAEVLLELSNQAQRSFHNRRAVEWKVNFGVWTILAAASALVVSKGITICCGYAAIPAFSMVVLHCIRLVAMHSRNTIDKRTQHFYQSELNELLKVDKKFENREDKDSPRNVIEREQLKYSEYWSIRSAVCVSAILAAIVTVLAAG